MNKNLINWTKNSEKTKEISRNSTNLLRVVFYFILSSEINVYQNG